MLKLGQILTAKQSGMQYKIIAINKTGYRLKSELIGLEFNQSLTEIKTNFYE